MDIAPLGDLSAPLRQSLLALLSNQGHARLGKRLVVDRDPDPVCLVAVAGNAVVGVIEGRVTNRWWNDDESVGHVSPYAFVQNLHVAQEARRSGTGRLLMRAFAGEARTAGCTWLELRAHWRDDGGVRVAFFTAMGLRLLPGREEDDIWGGAVADVLAVRM